MRRAAIVLALVLAALATARAEDLAPLPRTPLRVTVPDGFTFTAQPPGLLHEESGVRVSAQRLPGPLARNETLLTAEELAARNLRILRRTEVAVPVLSGSGETTPGLLLKVAPLGPDPSHTGWLLAVAVGGDTAVLRATVPTEHDALSPIVEHLLRTATWDPGHWFDPFLDRDFTLTEPEGLRLARHDPQGVVYTSSGRFPAAGEALFVVSTEPRREQGSAGELAQRRLARLPGYTGISVLETFTPRDGVAEVHATARQTSPDHSVYLYLALMVRGAHQVVAIGECPAEARDVCRSRFSTTVAGYHDQGR